MWECFRKYICCCIKEKEEEPYNWYPYLESNEL